MDAQGTIWAEVRRLQNAADVKEGSSAMQELRYVHTSLCPSVASLSPMACLLQILSSLIDHTGI